MLSLPIHDYGMSLYEFISYLIYYISFIVLLIYILYIYFDFMPAAAKLLQLCPTLSDAMDHSLSGSSVHEILQIRVLEWVAIPFSRGSSRPRD